MVVLLEEWKSSLVYFAENRAIKEIFMLTAYSGVVPAHQQRDRGDLRGWGRSIGSAWCSAMTVCVSQNNGSDVPQEKLLYRNPRSQ